MNILMIEDDQDTLASLRDVLEEDGHNFQTAGSLAEAFERDDLSTFSVIFSDRKLPDGLVDLHLPRLKAHAPDAAIIVITGYADLDGVAEAIRQGAVDYLVRPRNPQWLKARLTRIVEWREAAQRVAQAERLAAIGQMLTVLSHESRNDLQLAIGCLELLALEARGRPETLALVRRIKLAHDHLLQLYDDLRGYAAPIQLHRERCDVKGVVLQAWASLLPLQEGRDVRFKVLQDGEPFEWAVDRSRLEQVFRNILENAVAACADPVEITCQISETRVDGERMARITFNDNGPGLSLEQQRKIFDPFYTTKSTGTGLGMTISKQIVDAHGGDIRVESLPGCGARFIVTLPDVATPREANAPNRAAEHEDPRDGATYCEAGQR